MTKDEFKQLALGAIETLISMPDAPRRCIARPIIFEIRHEPNAALCALRAHLLGGDA